jgi:hypothetical protein
MATLSIISEKLSHDQLIEASFLAGALLNLSAAAAREGWESASMAGDTARVIEFASQLLEHLHDRVEGAP